MTTSDAEKLAHYVRSLSGFKFYETIDGNYDHIGATVADAVLQANNNYSTHVKPRVNRLLERYPDARTTSAVLRLLELTSITEFLGWRGEDRAERFRQVLDLFAREGIEAEADLRQWLAKEENLKKLDDIEGVGPKTIDYFKILVGISTSAVDRHLVHFLALAGLPPCSYQNAQIIINAAADILSVDRAHFDHSIWQFMSKRAASHNGKCYDAPYRGSRKHVLDWTGSPTFLAELAALLAPSPVRFPKNTVFMPRGVSAPAEARLEAFGPVCYPQLAVWAVLEDWWLTHKAGANTPNWDIALACEIHDRPGLVLVEAKANWPELGVAGKSLLIDASRKSRENHERIGAAIADACTGWRTVDQRINFSRDSHYQLANRLAFTWKLAVLGIPTILVYLGFTGDEGIRDAGEPFADDADWQKAFKTYASNTIPLELFDRALTIESTPTWLMVRSRHVLEISPPP